MRLQSALVGLAAVGLGVRLSAQAPEDSLTPRHLPGGLSVALPTAWVPLSDSAQMSANRILDTTLLHSRDTLIQASLKRGKVITLIHETARGRPDPSASINAAPSPGTKPSSFDGATPAQVAAALSFLCNTMREGLGRLGARVVSCDPAQVDRAAGRTIAITRLVRSGRLGFVTVWLAQFPDRDLIYTLTLSAPQAEESRYEPLFRNIWRSVEIPDP
jgi:hypothetical protein